MAKQLSRAKISYDKKPFLPHITLGRFRGKIPPRLPSFKKESLNVSRVVLFSSHLEREGSRYRKLLVIED